jgi:ADP-ribose pyrophosphatase YjhB (NUDIX family)
MQGEEGMRVTQVFDHYPRMRQSAGEFLFCPYCGKPLLMVESGGIQRPTCSSCGFIHFRNPSPTVSLLIVDGKKVLLGKRGGPPGKGTWSLPSGYIEYDDDFLTAAIREAKEETGLDVELISIINVVSSFVTAKFHFLGVYLVAQVLGGELAAADDLEAVEWFPIAGPLPEMGFEEDTHIIEMYVKGFTGLPVDSNFARINKRE